MKVNRFTLIFGSVIELAGWDAILSEFTGSLSEYKLNNLIQFISAKYIYHRVAKLQGPT